MSNICCVNTSRHLTYLISQLFGQTYRYNRRKGRQYFYVSLHSSTMTRHGLPRFVCKRERNSHFARTTPWLLITYRQQGLEHQQPRSWWRHQMETFSALLAICAGNSPVPVNSPHKGQWREALMFSLICAWINGWVNDREAGDLRRNCAHYDITVTELVYCPEIIPAWLNNASVSYSYTTQKPNQL